MINPTNSSDSTASALDLSLGTTGAAKRYYQTPADSMSADSAETLSQQLALQPEVRPEVVARGMALAADPNYPSAAIIQSVAEQIMQSPDPSSDGSNES